MISFVLRELTASSSEQRSSYLIKILSEHDGFAKAESCFNSKRNYTS